MVMSLPLKGIIYTAFKYTQTITMKRWSFLFSIIFFLGRKMLHCADLVSQTLQECMKFIAFLSLL